MTEPFGIESPASSTATPDVDLYEMLLAPEQRSALRSDLAEIRRRRLAAFDAVACWPAPFDRVHAKDTRPWPDLKAEPIDTVEP